MRMWQETRKKNKEEKEMKNKNHVPMETQPKDKEAEGNNTPAKTSDTGVTTCQEKSNTKSEELVIYVTKYGFDLLPGTTSTGGPSHGLAVHLD